MVIGERIKQMDMAGIHRLMDQGVCKDEKPDRYKEVRTARQTLTKTLQPLEKLAFIAYSLPICCIWNQAQCGIEIIHTW